MNKIPSKTEFDKIMDKRFSADVYNKLSEGKVAIAGLGGLGSNIAVMLARSGVGHIHLVDFDVVDISNLNRQAYFIKHLGVKKTIALKAILEEINPYITVSLTDEYVEEKNVNSIFGEYPIVCEAFDKAENKAMLVNSVLTYCPDAIVVSGTGMAGYGSSNTIVTKKISKNFYLCGDSSTDIDIGTGLMSPRVSICAGHQANQIIRLILGIKDT